MHKNVAIGLLAAGLLVALAAGPARNRYQQQSAFDMSSVAKAGSGTRQSPWVGWDDTLADLAQKKRLDCKIHFPAGYYKISRRITLLKGWYVYGDGISSSTILTPSDYTEGGFYAAGPLNGSAAGHIRIFDLALENTNISSTARGHAIEIFGLTSLWLDRLRLVNWPSGITLDQAELVCINGCQFEMFGGKRIPGMRGVWIVNGPDRVAGALKLITNVICVSDCFFNGDSPDQTFIVDDGGYTREFSRNTFNAGGCAIRLAGAVSGAMISNYFEGQAQGAILISHVTLDKRGAAGPVQPFTFINNLFATGRGPAVQIESSTANLVFIGNCFTGSPTAAHIVGIRNAVAGTTTVQSNSVTPNTRLFDTPDGALPAAPAR